MLFKNIRTGNVLSTSNPMNIELMNSSENYEVFVFPEENKAQKVKKPAEKQKK